MRLVTAGAILLVTVVSACSSSTMTSVGNHSTTTVPNPSGTTGTPALPDASPGPFPVGHTKLIIPAANGRPKLDVDVWYPSHASSAPKTTYAILPGVDIGARLATENPAAAAGKFPLVVYSHGSGGFSFVATFFTEVLASHGYVVAAADHPGDTIIDAYLRQQSNAVYDAGGAVRDRISDLRRETTAVLAARNARFSGSIDASKVVLAGHSIGGAGVIGAAVADPRVVAVVAMDPTSGILSGDQIRRLRVPLLMLWSNVGTDPETSMWDDARGPWYRVSIPSATHLGFTDVCGYQSLVAKWNKVLLPQGVDIRPYLQGLFRDNCRAPTIRPAPMQNLVDGYSLAFLSLVAGDKRWRATILKPRPRVQIEHSNP